MNLEVNYASGRGARPGLAYSGECFERHEVGIKDIPVRKILATMA